VVDSRRRRLRTTTKGFRIRELGSRRRQAWQSWLELRLFATINPKQQTIFVQTHTATTENALLHADEKLTAFVEHQVLTVTFYLECIQ
jgi:hypothetical protein